MRIMDVHTHLAGKHSYLDYPGLRRGCQAANLIAYMDKVGIEKSVVLTLDTKDVLKVENVVLTVADALRAQKEYPGRFVVFASVDVNRKNRKEIFLRHIEAGCRGLGEIKHTLFSDQRHYDLYEICSDMNLPVLGHIDVDLNKLEKVLKAFPKTTFIVHGPEFWTNIQTPVSGKPAAGEAKDTAVKNNKVAGLLRRYDNLFGDISAGSGYTALSGNPEYGRYFTAAYADKLIFGTDWPCLHEYKPPYANNRFGEDRWHLNLLKKYLGCSPKLERILSGNLRRILKLK